MKKRMVSILIGAFILGTIGVAQSMVITTGGTKGNYFKVGHNIRKMLGNQFEVVPSKGSIENLDRLMKGEADIAIVQMDALAWYIDQKPEAGTTIQIIGPAYEECVFIAVNVNGKIKSEDDLQSETATIAVGAKGSGSTVSWDYMRKLEPGYKKAKTEFVGDLVTIGKLALSKKEGDIQAFLFVMKPDPTNKMISTIANNKNLKFIDVDDKDLNDKLPATGEPVYRLKSVPYAKGLIGNKKVETICVDSAIVIRSDVPTEIQEALADLVMNYQSSLQ